MKKIFYLLLLMPLAFLASCNNDDDLPQVDLTVAMSNVYQDSSNGKLYYVNDEEVAPVIEGISATPVGGGKEATVTNVFYSLNNRFRLFGTEENPTTPVVPTELLSDGTNYINISAMVLQVDKSIAHCYLDVPFIVVDSTEDLPANIGDMGTYKVTMKMQTKD